MVTLSKSILTRLYCKEKMSMMEIAKHHGCSVHKIQYWMKQCQIPSRSMSDAAYTKHHPKGDPFIFRKPKNNEEQFLYGLGIGLYWGEGNKACKTAVRLGNTDPKLLQIFMEFLEKFFSIPRKDFHFGLQIFTDIDPEEALTYWRKTLHITQDQFYKPTVTISGSIGTYRKKSRHGVLTVYYNNVKVRNLLIGLLPSSLSA